jgi:hypothetical protein
MNAHSNNFVADHIGAQLGGPSAVVSFLVNELKLPADQVYLETNSGLNTNRMTPRGIVAVVRALSDEAARHGMKLEDLLAVASCDHGTLRRRMDGTGYECAVIGKTGTLTTTDGGMSNLAGVVETQDAGLIVFAILAQGNRIWEHKQMADQLLAEVVHDHPPAPVFDPQATRRNLLPSASLLAEPQLATHHAEPEKTDREKKEEERDEKADAEEQKTSARDEKASRDKATTKSKGEARASTESRSKKNETESRSQKNERALNDKQSRRKRR